MSAMLYWYATFIALLIAFAYVLYDVKNKKRYFFFFLAGSLLGFYFDIISFTNNWYTYPDFYFIEILGLPLSMTLAEGFAVAFTIYLFERFLLRKRLKYISTL